ncbi:ROK family protein [Pseudomonas aeruginosa]|uniref:ROK family protein n=1 Tax=Pseudomonas aeruginosa TaxID=287 RepID=UPI003D18D376
MFELARQGYKEAEFLTERSASTIAELIVSLKLLLDCQVVVVGGSVGLADGAIASGRVNPYPPDRKG